jgi:hypothetical protein
MFLNAENSSREFILHSTVDKILIDDCEIW